jgi:hypothetical protein
MRIRNPASNDPSISFSMWLCVLIRREQYEQELQAEDEQYIQADGLSGQQVCTHYYPLRKDIQRMRGLQFYTFWILSGIKRRVIDISQKNIGFYFSPNFLKCRVWFSFFNFSALSHSKFVKNANISKNNYAKNQYGYRSKNRRIFMMILLLLRGFPKSAL